jgi:lipopolysaccharide export system permease protein
MKILQKYFLLEYIGPLFLSLLVLTFVMILGNLVKIAELVINKGVDILSVLKLFFFLMPALLTYTLPVANLAAVLMSAGRFSNDNEILAIRVSGMNLIRFISPIIVMSMILSISLVILNDRIIPYAHFATRKTLVEVGIKNPAATLEPGVFINSFEKYILFIYAIDKDKLHNIRIYEPRGENKPARIIVAKEGEFIAIPEKKAVKIKLLNGTSDEPDPGNPNIFYKLNFKTYYMTLSLAEMQDREKIDKKPKDMTIHELEREIEKMKKQNIDPAPYTIEIHKKISLAFSCFVFMLLGLPLGIITHRREKSINFGIAFLIVGIYYLLLLSAETLALRGYLPPHISLWLPNAVFGSLGLLMTYRLCAY